LILDIDRFKEFNDRHGHLCGDFVLRELAFRIREIVRQEDLFARYGGEEFVLVLVETPHEEAVAVAERVRDLVENMPFRFESTPLKLTMSIGAATLDRAAPNPDRLLGNADEALHRAKVGGRNRVCY
jgi:two-component system cell cycle response regulator